MLFSTLISACLAISSSLASPIAVRQSTPTDNDILQYALTLEHLENAFYKEALDKFDEKAFTDAGFSSLVRKRFVEIASHEKTHVDFLAQVLGDKATHPCTYSFPYTDPKSFATLSMVLEGVGVSAYLGAAKFITDKSYLTAAGAILTTEARHAAWISSAVNDDAPWSGPLDTPLDLSQVFSLAAAFITSCPESNPALPVKAFPALSYAPSSPKPGDKVTLHYDSKNSGNEYFAIFSGLSPVFVPIKNFEVTLPSDLMGTVYGIVTSSNSAVTDDNTVAGPAIIVFPDHM